MEATISADGVKNAPDKDESQVSSACTNRQYLILMNSSRCSASSTFPTSSGHELARWQSTQSLPQTFSDSLSPSFQQYFAPVPHFATSFLSTGVRTKSAVGRKGSGIPQSSAGRATGSRRCPCQPDAPFAVCTFPSPRSDRTGGCRTWRIFGEAGAFDTSLRKSSRIRLGLGRMCGSKSTSFDL